jgi:hypothetical protein
MVGSGNSVIRDCTFSQLTTAVIQTANERGIIDNCYAALCTDDGFIQRSGYGEGVALWTGATVSNSAGNHSVILRTRAYNATGTRSGFRILANNSCRLVDCISEGLNPEYGVYYNNQGHTSGRMFTVENFHSENLPSESVIRVISDGRVIIDKFQQRKGGAVVLVDSTDSNATSSLIVIMDMPDIGADQTFTIPTTASFERFGSLGAQDPSNTAFWTGGTLPFYLTWIGLQNNTSSGGDVSQILGSKSKRILADGQFVDTDGAYAIRFEDATPSVARLKTISLTGESYTVTDFDDGFEGQVIWVRKVATTCTVEHDAAKIVMKDETDWTTGHPVRSFTYVNSRWYEV